MKKTIGIILSLLFFASVSFAGSRGQIVATSATPVSFTPISIQEGVTCVVRNGAYPVFVDWVGSTPTTTIGVPLSAGDTVDLDVYEFNNFKAIATGTTSTLYGMCN